MLSGQGAGVGSGAMRLVLLVAVLVLEVWSLSLAPDSKHIVLVGGGHAHAQVLKGLAFRPDDVRVTLVDPTRRAVYSGMVPGCVSGLYDSSDVEIALEPLARWASVDYVQASVTAVDPQLQTVTCDDGGVLRYDALSLDIGSTVRTTDGVDRWTIPTRPIGTLVERFDREEAVLRSAVDLEERELRIAIVGGGAAGIEMAFATVARFADVGAPGQETGPLMCLATLSDGAILNQASHDSQRGLSER